MNAYFVIILSILCFSTKISAITKSTYFYTDYVSFDDLRYYDRALKRIDTSSHFGLLGQNSEVQCALVCHHENSCNGFYVDNGACVFCVKTDEVNAFSEGENINLYNYGF